MRKIKEQISYFDEWLQFQKDGTIAAHVREPIKRCWEESREVGISGFDKPTIQFEDDEQFQATHKQSEHLIQAVHTKLEHLYDQLEKEMVYPIYLFNDSAVLLQYTGSINPKEFYDVVPVQPGLIAGVPFLGHTALTLTLATNKAHIMTGAEHTFAAFHSFTTFAAPIFHPINGKCIGVLASHMEHDAEVQPHFALLISIAMAIEEFIRMDYSHSNMFKIHEETMNLMDYCISIVSSDGYVVDANAAYRDLLAPQTVIGSIATDVIQSNFSHDLSESPLFRALYYKEESFNYELWTHINGKQYCFLCDTKIVYDRFDPDFYWIVQALKDITQKKEIELHVLQREKLISLGTLAAGLAHEIRNPLTTAKGFIQLLSENSSEHEAFSLIQNELNRISQLVNQFVLLSKPDSPQRSVIHVQTMLKQFATFIEPEGLLHGIEVTTQFCQTDATILADKNQLTQVFINVSRNAFTAMKRGGSYRIECQLRNRGYVEIRFIDNGKGIEEEHLNKILDPFFTTNEEGTGLGLPICYQIIEAHEGKMDIDSVVDVGTTVTIRLPRADVV